MSNEVISKSEEKRLLELGRQVFANSFPNPERKGCPGAAVLRAIAAGKGLGPDEDDWVSHCSRCSPCFREFGEFRRAFVRQRRLRRLCAAAIIIVAVCVGTLLAVNRYSRRSSEPTIAGNAQTASAIQNAMLDLRAWSAVRSDEAAPNPSGKPLELHRGLLALTIYLPMGSQPGRYDVRISSAKNQGALGVSGIARIEDGNTVLRVQLNLREFLAGQYSLGIRQPPWDWRHYLVTLR